MKVAELLDRQPEVWLPDNLLLLQEYLPHDPGCEGIVRLEFLGGELLYAMRIVSSGSFNLCPSETCNPLEEAAVGPAFFAHQEVPPEAVLLWRRIFYDVNANSNLRPSIAREFGFDPFERVVDFLIESIGRASPQEIPSTSL